jgi:hypothetical protein
VEYTLQRNSLSKKKILGYSRAVKGGRGRMVIPKKQIQYFMLRLSNQLSGAKRSLSGKKLNKQAKLINKLLAKTGSKSSYLEIGVDQGHTFTKIKSPTKHAVDPYGTYAKTNYRMTSEMFFALNKIFFKNKYDVIFIDSAHFSPIVDNEIKESFKILKKKRLYSSPRYRPTKQKSARAYTRRHTHLP